MSHTHTMQAAPDRTGDVYVCACGYQADGKLVRETCRYPVESELTQRFNRAKDAFAQVSIYFGLTDLAAFHDPHRTVLRRFALAMYELGEAIEQHE